MVNTLPLYQNPPLADAWHNVTSPGGYEWWYFDAEDVQSDRQIVAMLFDGCPFHPEYLRRYRAFVRNPTRVAPPRPSEYICACFTVIHAGKVEHQCFSRYPLEQFEARRDTRHVQVGPNSFTADGEQLQLRVADKVSASFAFRPRFTHLAVERDLFTDAQSRAMHRWIIADPLCDVTGEIQVANQTISFNGRGYHDHQFGTAPIVHQVGRWFRGRVLTDDRCVMFQFVQRADARESIEAALFEVDAQGVREIETSRSQIHVTWEKHAKHCERAEIGNVLTLEYPRIIEARSSSSALPVQVVYDATVNGQTGGHALCQTM